MGNGIIQKNDGILSEILGWVCDRLFLYEERREDLREEYQRILTMVSPPGFEPGTT